MLRAIAFGQRLVIKSFVLPFGGLSPKMPPMTTAFLSVKSSILSGNFAFGSRITISFCL
jgi:hypothetical protein